MNKGKRLGVSVKNHFTWKFNESHIHRPQTLLARASSCSIR